MVAILERQIAEAIRACRLARSVADGKLDPGEAHEQIAEIEHRGDTLRGKLVTQLATVLVAPIDREDLFRLSRSIDDVLDNLRDFVREWDLWQIAGPPMLSGSARRYRERPLRPPPGGADDRPRSD